MSGESKPPTVMYRSLRPAWLPRAVADQGVAVLLVAVTTLLRGGLGHLFPGILPLSGYFPAILLAAIVGGWRAGATALVLSIAVAWYFFIPPTRLPVLAANVLLFAGAGAFTVFVADRLRALMARLTLRDTQYRALFDTMSEGFALCEAIRDADGKLVDYIILEINPALQRMLRVGPEAVGTKYSASGNVSQRWLAACDSVLTTGVPLGREVHTAAVDRWHEIRLTRVGQDRIAQFFFDITARKAAEARQGALFDELNHRVKNNLAMVCGLLSLQARGAGPAERERLMKAVDRVQSIAQVHASLYQGPSRTDVDFGAYLETLCQGLSASIADAERIRIEVDAVSAFVPVDHVVPLGMVVNELVTNAAKHAYPSPAIGIISVRFSRDDAGLRLLVSDQGEGLSGDVEASSKGIGMKLVRSLIQQIGGDLAVEPQPGASFHIRLPTQVPSAADDRGRQQALI